MARDGMTTTAAAVTARPATDCRRLDGAVVDALGGEVGGQGEEAHPDHADRTGLSGPSLIAAELPHHDRRGENSIAESRPNPTRAIEDAITPAATATAASAVIHAMLAYSSQNPRRRSRAS